MAELARIEVVLVLQSVELFRYSSAGEILRLADIARERSFAAGETLYERGESAEVLYVVVRGAVALEGPEGVEERGPLCSLGVREILSGRVRGSGARAVADTLALAVDAEDFFDLLANNIEIVKGLFRQLLAGDGETEQEGGAAEPAPTPVEAARG